MLERLEYILTGTFPATDTDKRSYLPGNRSFFYLHNGPDKYEACNIMILRETHRLMNEEKIMCGEEKGGLYMKGPKWIEPDFMSEGKYEID